MRILYIDTTSNYLYASIVNENEILGDIKLQMNKDLSVFALREISTMFDNAGVKTSDIDKIIVANGPGSFTGIRVGVTIAKVYAWALNIEITTVSSLEVMACSSFTDKTFKIPMIDARRGCVFAGIFDMDNNEVFKMQYIELEKLEKVMIALPGSYSVITNDKIDMDSDVSFEEYTPNFLKICNMYKNKEGINPHMINPNYLKLTEAEEKKIEEIL